MVEAENEWSQAELRLRPWRCRRPPKQMVRSVATKKLQRTFIFFLRAHLVSDAKDTSTATRVKVQQDANIFVTEISPNTSIDFELAKNRQAYLLCMEGAVGAVVNGIETALNRHDAAELVGPLTLQTISKAEGAETAHLLLVEMLATGEGRTDI